MGTDPVFVWFDPAVRPPTAGDSVLVTAESGQIRPWRARAYRDGVFVGRTGHCNGRETAARLGELLLAKRPREKTDDNH